MLKTSTLPKLSMCSGIGGRAVGCPVIVFVFVFCGTHLVPLLPSTMPGLESCCINIY